MEKRLIFWIFHLFGGTFIAIHITLTYIISHSNFAGFRKPQKYDFAYRLIRNLSKNVWCIKHKIWIIQTYLKSTIWTVKIRKFIESKPKSITFCHLFLIMKGKYVRVISNWKISHFFVFCEKFWRMTLNWCSSYICLILCNPRIMIINPSENGR